MAQHVLLCGSRNWTDLTALDRVLDRLGPDVHIVHGTGATAFEALLAEETSKRKLTVTAFPVEWSKYGEGARDVRNRAMLRAGIDQVIAFRMEGPSPGTDQLIRLATEVGIPVHVIHDD
jgi:cytosine/adenosine deaminase-related metal-dependent hydrolase